MAEITNYGELKTELASYSHRTDLTAEIPGFIQIAENHVNNDLRVPEMIVTSTLTIPDTSGKFGLPADFLEMRGITGVDNDGATRPLTAYGITEIYRFSTSGQPKCFTVWDNEILFRGTPAVDDVFTMVYWARPAAFSADGDTSTLLTRFTTVYLYAALAELHTWVQDHDQAALAASRYDAAIDAFNTAGIQKRQRPTVAPAYNYGTSIRSAR